MRATGFYVTADSADAQAIEHLYVQHPATGSVESNATAAGLVVDCRCQRQRSSDVGE